MRALDLFAGAGGWDVAASELGIDVTGVENMPEAVATREANGLVTMYERYRDVWDLAELWDGIKVDSYDGLIASPPCQTFSMAGKGTGRKALDDVLYAIRSRYYTNVERLRHHSGVVDERTALVLTPLLFWHHMRPRWVAFEQVPTVLPVWEAMADVMREAGYSVWTGNLHAEQYGVPQTRKRAILMARRNNELWHFNVLPPEPTHSKYYPRDKTRLDPGVKPWVSMAEALGWAMTDRPSPTITGGGAETGGAEPIAKWAERYETHPMFQDRQLGQGRLERHGKPQDRTTDEPSYSMRGQASGSAPGGGYVLSPPHCPVCGGFQWPDLHDCKGDWTTERPAPTIVTTRRSAGGIIVGRQLPAGEGSAVGGHGWDGEKTTSKGGNGRRVTVQEAAILQGFPKDFVFCGGKGKQYLQIGNAIPPPLARAILESVTLSGKMNA